ncbi:uncharacterized protein LOC130976554 [Arachis stenosperma]|uniref:uncharacterized protein LOC130976554 n=1 Tax=Arachis stenosperma TaxID=217475 RepID=UPI0025AD3F9A|nr:uncharacterized protein LOC130976554 [Arachis stenosperma]
MDSSLSMIMKNNIVRFFLMLCFALFIVFLTNTIERANYLFGNNEYYVQVINGFSDNSSVPLVIWCSSEEMDLGGRALQEHDDFSWTMRPSFWGGNNEMKCTMKWDSTRRSFDAFMASRDTHRCGAYRMCYWMVTQDGFFFSNDQVNWSMDFLW